MEACALRFPTACCLEVSDLPRHQQQTASDQDAAAGEPPAAAGSGLADKLTLQEGQFTVSSSAC